MASNDRAGRPDYGRIRGGAQWAVEPFEETGELQEAGADPAGDVESNELHGAAGLVCGRCGRPLDGTTETRRTAAGDYVHESCPARPAHRG
jgi:hypothetical protein